MAASPPSKLTCILTHSLLHRVVRAGDCATSFRPTLVTPPASCQHPAIIWAASVRLQHAWEQVTIKQWGACVILRVGFFFCEKEQMHRWNFFFSLTKTKAVEKQKREDDTSFIFRVAVSGDDSLEREEKKTEQRRWPTWRGGKKKDREREREEGAQHRSWFLFLGCLSIHFSVVSCPQPLLQIHAEWGRCTQTAEVL